MERSQARFGSVEIDLIHTALDKQKWQYEQLSEEFQKDTVKNLKRVNLFNKTEQIDRKEFQRAKSIIGRSIFRGSYNLHTVTMTQTEVVIAVGYNKRKEGYFEEEKTLPEKCK